jgi:hypothetical protein
MSLIRYQAPELTPWSASDRWNTLRDELNSFFELPSWSSFPRAGQLFTSWSPALDLHQSTDNIVAVVELDRALRRSIPPQHRVAHPRGRQQSQRHLPRWNPDCDVAEG